MRTHYENTKEAMYNLLREILKMKKVMPDKLRLEYYLPMSGLIENFEFILKKLNEEIAPWE